MEMKVHELLFDEVAQHKLVSQPKSTIVERLVLAFRTMPQFKNVDGSEKKFLRKEPKELRPFCNRIRKALDVKEATFESDESFSIMSTEFYCETDETLRDEDILMARRLYAKEHPFVKALESNSINKNLNSLETLEETEVEEIIKAIDFPFSSFTNLITALGYFITENSFLSSSGLKIPGFENALIGTYVGTNAPLLDDLFVVVWQDKALRDQYYTLTFDSFTGYLSNGALPTYESMTSKGGAQ